MTHDRQAFVLANTVLQSPPFVPELILHLADEPMRTWGRLMEALQDADTEAPYWAFAWPGGQAVARYLLDHRREARGRSVLDLAAGSGICAIAALKVGARSVIASDIDPYAAHAIHLNAGANGVRPAFSEADLLDGDPPAVDLILAGDVCYQQPLADRAVAWLRAAAAQGTRVLMGDPGRAYFPRAELRLLAEYDVPIAARLEDRDIKRTGVYSFSLRG